jgi:hypothetical protein
LFPIFKQYIKEDFTKVLRKKKNEENCGLDLYANNQENKWHIDSGFSKNMTGDKTNFEFLTE